MSNLFKQGTGGAFIPSARPSIHNHPGCIFAERERMVRHGLYSDNQKHGDSEIAQGVDEIDNILSKPASSPIRSPSRQNGNRRNSLGTRNTSTEYYSDVLSKSVPATLPSQLHYSVSDDEQVTTEYDDQSSDNSDHSIDAPNWSNICRNRNFPTPQRLETEQLLRRENTERENNQDPSKVPIYIIGILVAVCAVVCSCVINIGHMFNTSYDQSGFYNAISSIGEKYNIDENSILQVQAGISTIFKKEDTGSFMFMYNSKSKNFNLNEFNEFINDISLAATKYLRNDSTPLQYTTMEGSKLDMKEHSELICRYRAELAASGVLLVRDLGAVPAGLAMAFHYYCDEYNPLVKKTAIFFTLDLAVCPVQHGKKSPHALIENCLTEKWRAIPADNIAPLLARVVSVVIDLTNTF